MTRPVIRPRASLWINGKRFRVSFKVDYSDNNSLIVMSPHKPRFLFKKQSVICVDVFIPPSKVYKIEFKAEFSHITKQWIYDRPDYWLEFKCLDKDIKTDYIRFKTEEEIFKYLQRENYNDRKLLDNPAKIQR